ncbi:hypothetical protein B0A48_13252 [Cryoendolithus antarcticus]|uniref:N-acetyltransferase domain-containing protein n=1 Tax=Cryoendolithus antarcticus TaxID=1507870 RepID=A0A1V8SPI4_9PEZI|nr:hypothetical protein B0A48_13252 [Cryoendolithus antarcticus]
MLGVQSQHEGSTAGLQVLGSRCYNYSLSPARVPHIDAAYAKHNHGQYRNRLVSWGAGSAATTTTTALVKARAPARSQSMPFITAVALPQDLPRLVEIEFAAFREEKANHQLSYRDSKIPEHSARALKFYRHCMTHLRSIDTDYRLSNGQHRKRTGSTSDLVVSSSTFSLGYRFRKVNDPRTGEIIAFAKTEMTVITLEDMQSPLDTGHENEPAMNRAWFALNEKLHREYNGLRRHCYFGMLATHPDHQHRGAATMLMKELIAEADALGLEMYCEATRTGKPLYEKYGFVAVKTLTFDPAAYAGSGLVETQWVMVRGALGKDGVRRPVREWDVAAAEARAQVDEALRKALP